MYWNISAFCPVGTVTSWIVTLDVLKLAYNCDRFACTLLNSNIRCIEMTAELFKIMLESSWIVTLDVLK